MAWWVYESLLLQGGKKVDHPLKELTATLTPCEKSNFCTIVKKKLTYVLSETRHTVTFNSHKYLGKACLKLWKFFLLNLPRFSKY